MQPQPGYPPQQPSPMPANPAQGVGIALVGCALAIAIGTFTKSWFSEGGIGLGLLGASFGGRSISWDEMGNVDGDIVAAGYIGFIGGLAALATCVAAGVMALTRNTHKIAVKAMQIPLGIAAFGMTFFLVRVLSEDRAPSLGFSGFLALGGVVGAGFVFKQLLQPLVERARAGIGQVPPAYAMHGGAHPQYPPAPPPVAAHAGPMCPRCGGPTEYVAQYQRWFCRRDNQYV